MFLVKTTFGSVWLELRNLWVQIYEVLCSHSFLWPGPQIPDKRQEKCSSPPLSSSVNKQASPWQDHSLSRGAFSFHKGLVNLSGSEEPFCLGNKTNEVLLRQNIIIVLGPENLWTLNFYLQPIFLFCKAPKGCAHRMQTKHNKEAFYTLLWP